MTEYIVEQSKENPDNWYVTIDDRIEGPYQSMEVANSWAVWFALHEFGSWLLERNSETAEILAKKVHSELTEFMECIHAHEAAIASESPVRELSDETAKRLDEYQALFDKAKLALTLAKPLPAPEQKPEAVQKPEQAQKQTGGWKWSRD